MPIRIQFQSQGAPLEPPRTDLHALARQPHDAALLDLVISLAQCQYDIDERTRAALPVDLLQDAERLIVDELVTRGVHVSTRLPSQPADPSARRRPRALPEYYTSVADRSDIRWEEVG